MSKKRVLVQQHFGLIRYFIAIVSVIILSFIVINIYSSIHDVGKAYCAKNIIVKNEKKVFTIPNKLDGSGFFIIIDAWNDMTFGSATEKFGFNYQYCNAAATASLSIYEQKLPKTPPRLVGNVEVIPEFLVKRNNHAIYDFDATFEHFAKRFSVFEYGGKTRLASYGSPSDEFFGGSVMITRINDTDALGQVFEISKNESNIFSLSLETDNLQYYSPPERKNWN